MPLSRKAWDFMETLIVQRSSPLHDAFSASRAAAKRKSPGSPVAWIPRVYGESMEAFGRVRLQSFIEAVETEGSTPSPEDLDKIREYVTSAARARAGAGSEEAKRIAQATGADLSGALLSELALDAQRVATDLSRELDIWVARRELRPQLPTPSSGGSADDFDVAVSFAGEERTTVEQFVELLKARGLRVFYDKDHIPDLWGRHLTEALDEIYRKRARLCVPFVSRAYVEKTWTRHELRSAEARALKEKDAYILPIRVDADVDLPGLPPTIAYVSLSEYSLEQIADILTRKLGKIS